MLGDKRPNRAHEALAELERRGLLDAVITQNVDRLHRAAGSQRIIELHGSIATSSCTSCGATYRLEEILALFTDDGVAECRTCARAGQARRRPVRRAASRGGDGATRQALTERADLMPASAPRSRSIRPPGCPSWPWRAAPAWRSSPRGRPPYDRGRRGQAQRRRGRGAGRPARGTRVSRALTPAARIAVQRSAARSRASSVPRRVAVVEHQRVAVGVREEAPCGRRRCR